MFPKLFSFYHRTYPVTEVLEQRKRGRQNRAKLNDKKSNNNYATICHPRAQNIKNYSSGVRFEVFCFASSDSLPAPEDKLLCRYLAKGTDLFTIS
jgi:hypothetical protein